MPEGQKKRLRKLRAERRTPERQWAIQSKARRILREALKRTTDTLALAEVDRDIVQVNRTLLVDDLKVILTAARSTLKRTP